MNFSASAIMAGMNQNAGHHRSTIQFDAVIGQTKAKELLARSLDRHSVSHAYLFCGPSGVGKKHLAVAFAALVNCRNPSGRNVCEQCPNCRKYMAGSHPDLLIIEPDGSFIKINQIRELKKTLSYPPFEAEHRVVLLTDIETMRKEAANSLLKTLEEPPPGTVLLLTANDGNRILPTIISRCHTIPFYPLPRTDLARKLAVDLDLPQDEAASLAVVAEGSLGRALLLHQKNLLPLRKNCVETLLALQPCGLNAVQTIFSLSADLSDLKDDLVELLDLLNSWFRDIVVFQAGEKARIMNLDLVPSLEAASQRWNLQRLSANIDKIGHAKKQLGRNCNRALVCETLLFGLL